MRGYPFRVYQEDDGSWAAEVPDLPGCVAGADAPDELFELLADAIDEWINSAERDGAPIPEPSAPSRYSGKFVARVPVSLHEQLAWRAEQEGCSLNTVVVTALTAYVSRVKDEFAAQVESPAAWPGVEWDFESGDVVAVGYRVMHYGKLDAVEWRSGEQRGGNIVDLADARRAVVQ